MNNLPLQPTELEQVCLVLSRHPTVLNATIFGSRAKGTHSQRSDIDLALALNSITYEPLIKHIERVGIKIYFRKEQIHI